MGVRPVLLWDVMDTLVQDPFFEVMPRFFGMGFEAMLAAKHPGAWVEFELGRCDEASFLRRFFDDGRAFDTEAFRRCVRESYTWVEGMEALLADLHVAGCEMHALSNYPVWYRWIDKQLGLSRYLSWRFVSCRTGVRKPDPQAFLSAASALGRTPDQCLFIDDRARNCQAARDLGMAALEFTGDAAALRRALARQGLLDPAPGGTP